MLTPEQLDHLYMRAGLGKFHLKDYAMECEYDRCIYGFARAIEAEVRKDEDALIRQMLEHLEVVTDEGPDGEGWQSQDLKNTIAAATARLEKAP